MATAPGPTHLQSLPPELHLIIAQFLSFDDGTDVRNLLRVSRYWRKLLYPERFSTISVTIRTEEDESRFLELCRILYDDAMCLVTKPKIKHIHISLERQPTGAIDDLHKDVLAEAPRLATPAVVAGPMLETFSLWTPYEDSSFGPNNVPDNKIVVIAGALLFGLLAARPPKLRELTLRTPLYPLTSILAKRSMGTDPFPALTHLHLISGDRFSALMSSGLLENAFRHVEILKISGASRADGACLVIWNSVLRSTSASSPDEDSEEPDSRFAFLPDSVRSVTIQFPSNELPRYAASLSEEQRALREMLMREKLDDAMRLSGERRSSLKVQVLDTPAYIPENVREHWLERKRIK